MSNPSVPPSDPSASKALRELIETGRQRVFIPRKGYATFVLCVERDEPEPREPPKWKPASESLLAALRSSSHMDSPGSDHPSALRALIARWRADAKMWDESGAPCASEWARIAMMCADDLEALVPPVEATPPTPKEER